MYFCLVVIVIAGISDVFTRESSKIRIANDGGYEDIVVKIEEELDEEDCPDILRGLEVR